LFFITWFGAVGFVKLVNLLSKNWEWGICKEAMFSPKQIISQVPTPKLDSVMMI
jgi:hypothetical protein